MIIITMKQTGGQIGYKTQTEFGPKNNFQPGVQRIVIHGNFGQAIHNYLDAQIMKKNIRYPETMIVK